MIGTSRFGYLGTGTSVPLPREDTLFAIIAAVLLALVLILDLANESLGSVLTPGFLTTAALLCIALHLAGAGAWSRRYRSYRGRRP
jgi:branched-subunit amino acid permease